MLLKSKGALRLLVTVAALACAAPTLAVDSGGGSSTNSSTSSSSAGPTLDDARAQIRGKHWKSAVSILKQVLADDPNNADANNLMGYSLRKGGNPDRAEGFYLKALKLSPKHKGANEYLGELYVETGQLKKAQERLVALEAICGKGCEEYKDLKSAIAKAS